MAYSRSAIIIIFYADDDHKCEDNLGLAWSSSLSNAYEKARAGIKRAFNNGSKMKVVIHDLMNRRKDEEISFEQLIKES